MNKDQLQAVVIVTGMVLGGIMAMNGTPGVWFPWTVAALVVIFG